MYKHEIYKIFSRKSIYVILLLIIVLIVYANRTVDGDITLKGEKYDQLFEKWSGPITEEKLMEARSHMEASDAGIGGPRSQSKWDEDVVHRLFSLAGSHAQTLIEHKDSLQIKLDKMNTETYAYKVALKELTMLQKLGDPFEFYLIRSWQGMFSFIEPILTVMIMATLIILGLTPIFTDEYANRTMELVLVTKNGKWKIIATKILAGITFISFIFICLHVVNFGVQVVKFGGANGFNAPIQNLNLWTNNDFAQSPFPWKAWQLYAITLTVQLFASISLGLLVIILSMIFKNTMMTILVSGAIVAGPTFIGQFMMEHPFTNFLLSFNYVEWIKTIPLFEHFTVYNFFGYPMLYSTLLLIIFSIVTLMIILGIFQTHKRTQINN